MSQFHEGEITVQTQVGVRKEAESISHVINPLIQPQAEEFLRARRIAIASTIDAKGRCWASLLTGKSGLIEVRGETEVVIAPDVISGDPFWNNLVHNPNLGLLTIDFLKRRRLRLNGIATLQGNKINLKTQQVFFNCPKYITPRDFESQIGDRPGFNSAVSSALNPHQQNWIAEADTFFITSYHPKKGADASHRGGNPGFIRIINARCLIFPDYTGNNLFQTFGNLTVNPRTGLLFIDFNHGHTLQLTGKAEILWETELLTEFADAKRLVKVELEEIIENA